MSDKTEQCGGGLAKAFWASPGPDTRREAAMLGLKGVLMGAADIVPGVSGGTMAFITGIYDQLIDAVRSVNGRFVASLLRGDLSGALAQVHLRFLLPLVVGILLAIVTMARVIHFLLGHYPTMVWSAFFGLIAASVVMVVKDVWPLKGRDVAVAALFALGGYVLSGAIPRATPDSLWFVLFCGAVAICAMILPGISGAFILLVLGKYEFITGAVKNPFLDQNFLVLAVFAIGCAVGLAGFSRLLHYLLGHWRRTTISALAGIMAGCMRKLWPFKEVLETARIGGKEVVLREANVLPANFDFEAGLALAMMLAGFMLVMAIDRFAGKRA